MARLAIERCKRLAEQGGHCVLVVDSLTRLTRAFNKTIHRGPIASGGLYVQALEFPKMLFGAARAFAEGGSLTTIATALVGTHSQMDDAIFQEFKGTGNMDVVLDSKLADMGIWPALNVAASRTRNEELLFTPAEAEAAKLIRRSLANEPGQRRTQKLVEQLQRFESNEELIRLVANATTRNA